MKAAQQQTLVMFYLLIGEAFDFSPIRKDFYNRCAQVICENDEVAARAYKTVEATANDIVSDFVKSFE